MYMYKRYWPIEAGLHIDASTVLSVDKTVGRPTAFIYQVGASLLSAPMLVIGNQTKIN